MRQGLVMITMKGVLNMGEAMVSGGKAKYFCLLNNPALSWFKPSLS
jgi:hypothetical protein